MGVFRQVGHDTGEHEYMAEHRIMGWHCLANASKSFPVIAVLYTHETLVSQVDSPCPLLVPLQEEDHHRSQHNRRKGD